MNYKNAGEKVIADKVGKIGLLKVGHHGYIGSTSFGFVKKLKPEYAIICNSSSNVYPDVRFKLKHISKSKIYCTADCGGVKAVFKEKIYVNGNIMD